MRAVAEGSASVVHEVGFQSLLYTVKCGIGSAGSKIRDIAEEVTRRLGEEVLEVAGDAEERARWTRAALIGGTISIIGNTSRSGSARDRCCARRRLAAYVLVGTEGFHLRLQD